MASPHVAGGMAIVKGAVMDRFPELSAGEQKDMVDTLLMCTSSIVYDGDTPVSPRKQGAGLMDINAAAKNSGLPFRKRNGAAQAGAAG